MEQNKSFETVKVLLVDDDEEDYLIIRQLFTKMTSIDTKLEWISSSEMAIGVINEARHDAYLIDYKLDALNGLDVLQSVKAYERPEPFILLTGISDQLVERKSLQLAASDFLVKRNLTSDNLARSLYYALGRKEQEKQKIDQLVELNRTKDEFISIASHQLRTPATTVKQYIAMVIDGMGGDVSDKQKMMLEKAYESNERQLSIINDLLKVAQVNAGRVEVVLAKTDVSALLKSSILDHKPSFEELQQKLVGDIPDGITANIDSRTIRMVVDNLLENARKYSEKKSETSLSLSKSKGKIVITVCDQGVGVEHPDRLFQKFSRIPNPLSTIVGGTGLGLYWAHSIVSLHGGELTYKPCEPSGSAFIVSIPSM